MIIQLQCQLFVLLLAKYAIKTVYEFSDVETINIQAINTNFTTVTLLVKVLQAKQF